MVSVREGGSTLAGLMHYYVLELRTSVSHHICRREGKEAA